MKTVSQNQLNEIQKEWMGQLGRLRSDSTKRFHRVVMNLRPHHPIINLDEVVIELAHQELDEELKSELLEEFLYACKSPTQTKDNEGLSRLFKGYEWSKKQFETFFSSYEFLTTEEKRVVEQWINTDYRMDPRDLNELSEVATFLEIPLEANNKSWLYSSFLNKQDAFD